ncbi:S49 family peptidase [Arhodomonas sp. AD133]|uniref:S49 family peptidase n=1 Tax=Arhodomonas sp. AD133 TaxID=3415009 RepID=UPI003EBFC683
MTNYSHIAHRVFNRALLVEPSYARVFVGALAERLDVRSLALPDGITVDAAELRSTAAGFAPRERGLVDTVDGIAIIPVEGTLAHRYGHLEPFSGMTGYDGIQAKMEAALEDTSIRGILLDINSPGGEVSGCFDLTDFIYESRGIKPMWAVADELACSAAYSLASAADRIIAPRTADLGSVGVLTMHVDQSQMVEDMGLDVTFIHAGAHKVDGNPFEPLPEDVRADIQAEIDELYAMFAHTVARNRGMGDGAVRDTEARVYNTRDAIEVGFADEVMAVRDVMPAFDEYLSDQRTNRRTFASEVKDMSLSLFGRGRRKAAESEQPEKPAETESTEAEETEATDESGEGGQATEPESGDQEPATEREHQEAASAQQIVAMCSEAKVDSLANALIQQGATVEQARAEIANAGALRDAFAAAELSPQLAEQAIRTGMDAEFARTLLTEITAQASGEELNHHQPPKTAAPDGGKDWADVYSSV